MSAPQNPSPQSRPPAITPVLTFSGKQYGKAEEAVRFYVSLFPHSSLDSLQRHGEGEQVPVGELQQAVFTLAGQRFIATETQGDNRFAFTPAIALCVEFQSKDELTSLFDRLSKEGKIHMPLREYPSSELYTWFDDKYGVSWMLEIKKSSSR